MSGASLGAYGNLPRVAAHASPYGTASPPGSAALLSAARHRSGSFEDEDEAGLRRMASIESAAGLGFDDGVVGTGYAVASSKRNNDFHAQFPAVGEDDYLIEGALVLRSVILMVWLSDSE